MTHFDIGFLSTLEREFKLKITQDVIIPPMVDCFIDAAVYESLQLAKSEFRSELNLFELLIILQYIHPPCRCAFCIVRARSVLNYRDGQGSGVGWLLLRFVVELL